MLYRYDVHDNYSHYEFAQPQADPYFVHPNSAAAQLGLTPEEAREMVEEQDRWFREECQQWLEEDRTWVSTEHQDQGQYSDKARWAPTPPIGDPKPTPQGCETPD